MYKYKLITERFITTFNKDDLSKYIDEIWDIMQKSYEYIGGFKTASSKEELLNKTSLAKLVKKNNKIVAAALYKDSSGRKSIAGGYDGSEEGKKGILKIYKEDIDLGRSWAEVSGKAETVKLKMGAIPLPNTEAERVLGKPIESLDDDGYHYIRIIKGEPHRKMIIGNIN